jgi:hypothetical protein
MKKGGRVSWKYGKNKAIGKIKEKFTQPVKKEIKGSLIKRNASKQKPAYLIEQANGNRVLKSETELKM